MLTKRVPAFFALCTTLTIFLVACGESAPPASPPASPPVTTAPSTPAASPVVASGKTLYEANCALCHGRLGEGGKAPDGTIATPLSAHMRAHEGLGHEAEHIIPAVLDGLHEEEDGGTRVLDDAMPRFRGKLTEAEVTSVMSYMETLP